MHAICVHQAGNIQAIVNQQRRPDLPRGPTQPPPPSEQLPHWQLGIPQLNSQATIAKGDAPQKFTVAKARPVANLNNLRC